MCVYIYIYIWGFDYKFTNYNVKRNVELDKDNFDIHPSGKICVVLLTEPNKICCLFRICTC